MELLGFTSAQTGHLFLLINVHYNTIHLFYSITENHCCPAYFSKDLFIPKSGPQIMILLLDMKKAKLTFVNFFLTFVDILDPQ